MRTRNAALIAVLALALTGCAGTVNDAPASTAPAPEASETSAPLVAEEVEETAEPMTGEEQYLVDVRHVLTNNRETSIPNATDEQLLQAGYDACEQLASGVAEGDVRVIENEPLDPQMDSYMDSWIITGIASGRIC